MIKTVTPIFADEDVAATFDLWSGELLEKMLFLRQMIFEIAACTEGVGKLVETLKWNVPAYLTERPKSGTTIRLEAKNDTGEYGLYVPCSTTLIEQCRELYPNAFTFDKNRGLKFNRNTPIPETELRHFIAMALTYHVKSGPNKK